MPTYVSLDPDAVISNPNLSAAYPGGSTAGANIVAAIADAGSVDFADYISYDSGDTDDQFETIFGTTNPSLPSNKKCVAVRFAVWVAGLLTGTDITALLWVRNGSSGAEVFAMNYSGNPGVSGGWIFSNWVSTEPGTGAAYTATPLNNLQFRLIGASVADVPRIFAVHADLWLATKPVTTATPNPFITGLTAKDPLINLSQAADGDAPWHMRVKVFTKAVAEGGGFNPDTSTNVHDSGWINWSSSYQVPTGSLSYNTQYYVYAVSSTFAGGGVGEYIGDWSGQIFETTSRPVVNVTAPSTTTSRPSIAWTYTDADSKAQAYSEIRIYEQPAGGWTGFDPDTTTEVPVVSTFVDDGGPWVSTVSLDNSTTFRAYVRSFTTTPFVADSAWNNEQWTTSYTQPTAPTVTATADATNGRMTVTIRNNQNDPTALITVEKSYDNGTTWSILRNNTNDDTVQNGRGVSDIDIGYNVTTTYYDYEPPFNQNCKYRGFTETSNLGIPVKSNYATSATVNLNIDVVWVSVVLDPGSGLHFLVQDVWLTKTQRKQRGTYEPLGRSKPIVFRGSANQNNFAMSFLATNVFVVAALQNMLDSNNTLLVRTAQKRYYVEHATDMNVITNLWDDLHSRGKVGMFQCQFVEVEVPAI